jgi:hypothetical protein
MVNAVSVGTIATSADRSTIRSNAPPGYFNKNSGNSLRSPSDFDPPRYAGTASHRSSILSRTRLASEMEKDASILML